MNSKVETQRSRFDSLKLGIAVALLAAAIVAFYRFDEQLLVLRVLGLLVVAGISVLIAAQSSTGKNIIGFIKGAQTEVRKVVWPTRAETVQTTLAVILMVFLVGIFLWLLDMVLLWAIQLLTGQGG
ncbi:MAG: preprotein translocase subunit SecE [Gammaproteobacteria bacterium]|jgi:preprotein translocase subunit SecE|nr:preprotein translocase subunit SecE [Gammaproteobacteria bacterium]